jgi:hypothetical protein
MSDPAEARVREALDHLMTAWDDEAELDLGAYLAPRILSAVRAAALEQCAVLGVRCDTVSHFTSRVVLDAALRAMSGGTDGK